MGLWLAARPARAASHAAATWRPPRRYRNLRELLLAAVLVLLAFFLSSLAPAHSLEQGVEAGAGACTAPPGPGTAAAVCCAAGDHLLAGFGIAKFIVHTCGLHYLATAPLLLRVRGC